MSCIMAGFAITLLQNVAVFFLVSTSSSSSAYEYCVKPANSSESLCSDKSSICAGNCKSLMYYVNYNNKYSNFTKNTTFWFLPGYHELTNSTLLSNISTLQLKRLRTTAAVICTEYYGSLSFANITNLTIEGLNIYDCSAPSPKYRIHVALEIILVHNLTLTAVEIHNTTGYGLSLSDILGYSFIDSIMVESSHNSSVCYGGKPCYGGNLALHWSSTKDNISAENVLSITNSKFLNGKNHGYASGVFIRLDRQTNLSVTLKNCTVVGNTGYKGANVGVMDMYSSLHPPNITLQGCNISSGRASNVGGGMYATFNPGIQSNTSPTIVPILTIENTTFENNVSPHVGAAIFLRLHENITSTVGVLSFTNCSFAGNSLSLPRNDTVGHGGVAVHIIVFELPLYKKHKTILFQLEFTLCNFSQNEIEPHSIESSRNGVLFLQGIQSIKLMNSRFVNNRCTGIIAIQSNLMLYGYNLIQNHTGTRGGGMVFCSASKVYLHADTVLNITQNTASQFGGGIFVEDDCSQVVPYCFFQVDPSTWNRTTVHLIDNNAKYAGSAVYGGLINDCLFYEEPDLDFNSIDNLIIFNAIFHISGGKQGVSTVSSNPLKVCFCSGGIFNVMHCSNNIHKKVIPGSTFYISAILVGQWYGPVPGVVNTICKGNCHIPIEQQTQTLSLPSIELNCSLLNYTVYSSENTVVTLQLLVEDSYYQYSSYTKRTSTVTVHVQRCPLGFTLHDQSCVCFLRNRYIECNLAGKKSTIIRQPPVWIGFLHSPTNTSDIIFHQFCPLGYCYNKNITIKTNDSYFDQDMQCAQNRSGLLCGKCRPHHSLGFGSSECYRCSSQHNFLRIGGVLLVCAAAGALIVFLLTWLNLTVTEGVLNGLIFYANIIQVNKDIFFPPDNRINPLATFIAWMNLDFGINVCFYHRMDTYGKTWLQFLFPLYIWLLSAAVIYFSRKFQLISKLAGRNAVKVLATLLLLSFGKLLRIIITIVSLTTVKTKHPHSVKVVWLPDANLEYMKGRHILLFVCACVAGIATLLYALSLTFIQCLRRLPRGRLFSWIQRLKPFFDAYTGPYKDKYHFWTGFLLLIRAFLFICFALNVGSGPALNLTLIATVCSVLLIAIQLGIYRNLLLGILESSMYANLAIFSTITMFLLDDLVNTRKVAIVYVFVGSALLTLLGLLVYHSYKRLSGHPKCGQIKEWCLEKVRSHSAATVLVQPVLINDYTSDSEESEENEEVEQLLHSTSMQPDSELREPLIDNVH